MSDLLFRLEYVEADLRECECPKRSKELAEIRSDLIRQLHGEDIQLQPVSPPQKTSESMILAEVAELLSR